MTHSPQWVYDHFGRPAWASAGGYCCAFRGFATESKGSVLIHAYDLETGGRIGFVYDRLPSGAQWQVVGVVYDAEHSTNPKHLQQFFPNGAPRTARLATCLDKDFYHLSESEISGGEVSAPAIFAIWNAPHGRLFYGQYLAPPLQTRYDPVSASDVPVLPRSLDELPMTEFGYFESVGKVMDLHIDTDEDFSITTINKTCVRGG